MTDNQNILDALKGTYTDEQFSGATGLRAVREDISMYIGNADIRGLQQAVNEIVENCNDEAKESNQILKDKGLKPVEHTIYITIYKNGGLRVKDNGRGIPITPKDVDGIVKPVIRHAYESVSFGGKSTKGKGYRVRTSGVHGAGGGVVNALSKEFVVTTTRIDENASYRVKYCQAELVEDVHKIETLKDANGNLDHGTDVYFLYDPEIMALTDRFGNKKDFPYDPQDIIQKCKDYALGLEMVSYVVEWELPNGEKGKETIDWKDYDISNIMQNKSVNGKVYEFTDSFCEEETPDMPKNTRLNYEMFIKFCEGKPALTDSTSFRTLVNGLTMNRSTLDGKILKLINDHIFARIKTLKNYDAKVPFRVDWSMTNIHCFTSIEIENPMFGAQVKDAFDNPKFNNMIEDRLKTFFQTQDGIDLLATGVMRNMKSYEYALSKYVEELNNQKSKQTQKVTQQAIRSKIPKDKLSIPKNARIQDCFLIIIEGLTASATLKQALMSLPPIFATFPIKGKINNVLINPVVETKSTTNRQLCDELIYAMNLPWKRVVILSDGDFDGQQIKDLLSIFAMEHAPKLLTQNRLSWIPAPIIKITYSDGTETKSVCFNSMKQAEKKIEEVKGRLISQQKYKGLGQMNAEDLKFLLTLDANHNLRHEIVLVPSSPHMSDERKFFDVFFGPSAVARQDYICREYGTTRFNDYFFTRDQRLKDLSFSTDIDSVSDTFLRDHPVINTATLLNSNITYTDELEVDTSTEEPVYLKPIEYLQMYENSKTINVDYENLIKDLGVEEIPEVEYNKVEDLEIETETEDELV